MTISLQALTPFQRQAALGVGDRRLKGQFDARYVSAMWVVLPGPRPTHQTLNYDVSGCQLSASNAPLTMHVPALCLSCTGFTALLQEQHPKTSGFYLTGSYLCGMQRQVGWRGLKSRGALSACGCVFSLSISLSFVSDVLAARSTVPSAPPLGLSSHFVLILWPKFVPLPK